MVDLGKMETYKRIIIIAFIEISSDNGNSDPVMTFIINLRNLLPHSLFCFSSLNSMGIRGTTVQHILLYLGSVILYPLGTFLQN
jgi:hypothetical protein